jgi:hypothetical protein
MGCIDCQEHFTKGYQKGYDAAADHLFNRQVDALEAIDQLTEFCQSCTPAEAVYIEDHIRVMLGYVLVKSKEYAKQRRRARNL